MTLQDLKNKKIHFVGIGGIGMSGIAELLVQQGYQVSGSDISFNENIERLAEKDIAIKLGHDPSHLEGKDVLVVSTGIKADNPELQEARRRGLFILHRAEMLALLMEKPQRIVISGTHGKTTTTALVGWVLETAGLDPTVINGGVMTEWESNIKGGKGSWYVAEADESDGSFLKLSKEMALITNMDLEHMDYYGSAEKLYVAFERFVTEFESPGVAILGIDHPKVYALWQKIKSTQKCLTYGIHKEGNVRAENIRMTQEGAFFDLIKGNSRTGIFLSLHGHHNVLNALGAAAVAFQWGLTEDVVSKAFSSFQGVHRRFTRTGNWEGITIIDDYAHHPVEIQATLLAAKKAAEGRIIAVLQPHRYSRLESHFKDFSRCCEGADVTIVLPVYAAQESPREGIDHKALVKAMKGDVHCCDKLEDLPRVVHSFARAGDMIVCLGAGSISSLAHALPIQLSQLSQ